MTTDRNEDANMAMPINSTTDTPTDMITIHVDRLQHEAVNELIRTAAWLHGYLRCELQLTADNDGTCDRHHILTAFNRLHAACVQLNGEYSGLGLPQGLPDSELNDGETDHEGN